MKKIKKRHKFMWITLSILTALVLGLVLFLNSPAFGRLPRGERLERIKASQNWDGKRFRNLSETPQLTSDKGFVRQMFDFIFRTVDGLHPTEAIPSMKTDLHTIDPDHDVLVWLGHGAYFIRWQGRRILVDPTLVTASPLPMFNRAFRGSDRYTPEDIPPIDYLIITHDHWDHLDYRTVMQIKDRTGTVICPLGVGEHFEKWGWDAASLLEMDWNEEARLEGGMIVNCLPARHFSGRGLRRDRSLWASFLLETPAGNIYIGGDGGYDSHFAEIGERFGPIDLAVLENGQYNEDWRYIHMLPADLVRAIEDLSPRRVLTVHNSKYALSKHHWKEPLERISAATLPDSVQLLTPMIGQRVDLNDPTAHFERWWETPDN